jgi:hypothetical protein
MGTENRPHLLRHRVLAGEAFYRVVDASAGVVVVEVVSAPGLAPGTRLRFTQEAVAQMSLVEEAQWQRGPAALSEADKDTESDPVAQPDQRSSAA